MIKIDEENIVITSKEYKDNKIEIDKHTISINDNFKYDRKNTENVFTIKFTSDIKENIRLLKKLKRTVKKGIVFGKSYNEYHVLGIIDNANEEIEKCIKTIFIKDKDKKYEYLYDAICDELDRKWNTVNPCEFKNNICVEERERARIPRKNGCCYSFWYSKNPLRIEGVHQCDFLDQKKHCTNKNASCKIFVCPYLTKKGRFKINTKEILLMQVFLNKYQKLVLKNNFFVAREEFIAKLKKEEKRIKPFLLYYSNRDFMIYKFTPKEKRKLAKKYDKIYKETKGLRQFENK